MSKNTLLGNFKPNPNEIATELEGIRLAAFLRNYPDAIDRCKHHTLDGYDWSEILSKHPHLKDYCDFSTLTGRDWCRLLCNQPDFVGTCDWGIFDKWDLNMLSSLAPDIIQENIEVQEFIVREFHFGIKLIPNPPVEIQALHDMLWEL